MDNLARDPSGSSSIAGQPQQNNQDPLYLVNQIKDREINDFKNKANFMSDLSLKQERARALFDPSKTATETNQGLPSGGSGMPQGFSAVMGHDPNQQTQQQKDELGIRQQGMNLEGQRIAQQGKLGEQALGIKSDQEKLNQQKSDQIHQQKINELEAKQTDFKQKLDLAHQQLTDKNTSLESQLKLHQSIADNTKAFHDAEKSKMELTFQKQASEHKDKMDMMQKQLDAKNAPVTKQEEMTPDGKKITTTSRGSKVQVTGKDGQTYEIPADKVDEWNQNHAPEEQGDKPETEQSSGDGE